ncbi:uncharacterized protein N7469_000904 [Penicillium citrinum]|uniref:Uncharacterized protein n=1 Tax=Penicillium citrinum TaxID=5077 RepID=A0A9W9PF31_PENCI|nr:uncharacterized protein N7469_000904 [Penicillium citrinum]KAJ5242577.1 hypothetical protein N7469_000904 [Penicillium citrinum]
MWQLWQGPPSLAGIIAGPTVQDVNWALMLRLLTVIFRGNLPVDRVEAYESRWPAIPRRPTHRPTIQTFDFLGPKSDVELFERLDLFLILVARVRQEATLPSCARSAPETSH